MPASNDIKMQRIYLRQGVLSLFALVLIACEKPYVGLDEDETIEPANLIVNVAGFEQMPFDKGITSRTESEAAAVCTRLNFVFYQGDTKVKSIPQRVADADFGSISLSLPQGSYKMAVIGHSSVASAKIESLDKISFEKSLVTDTFCYYEEIEVGEEPKTLDVVLKRVVAMFRLQLSEDLPEGISQLKFYYTGGSSTLSAVTGYGSVNSKQTVVLDVVPAQRVFEVYTIPHSEQDELKMTITALGVNGSSVMERSFVSIPVQRNIITSYTGSLQNTDQPDNPDDPDDPDSPDNPEVLATGSVQSNVMVSAEWDGEDPHTF